LTRRRGSAQRGRVQQGRQGYDLAVVGAGIVGLALAAEARERGLRAVVLERDERAAGASVRNFGHVGATAQRGQALEFAWAARERWLQLGEKAGFDVAQSGTVVVARTPAEAAALEELAAERGREQVVLLTAAGVRARLPVAGQEVTGGAHLPLDLRVNAPDAIAALTAWLAGAGVEVRFGAHVGSVASGAVRTARGEVEAARVVCAVGHDVDRLFPAVAGAVGLRRCRLHMLEVTLPRPAAIAPAVLTGSAILRYGGLAALPSAAAVRREFEARRPELLAVEMNLMCTQRPDGSVVLGDTHHYARTHSPFDDEHVSDLLLREGARLLGAPLTVRRRWRGVYAHSAATDFLIAEPAPGVRVVSVTAGIGMTTAFGLAPAVLDQLL
jgi:FAD dependent oxidoreductase TIGR03364